MDIRHHRTLLRRHRVKLRPRSTTSPHPQKHHPTTSQNHRPQSPQHRSQIRPVHRDTIPHIPTRTPKTHQKITPLYDKPKPNKLNRYTGNRHIRKLDGQRQLQRQNPPHVPQRTQRHHIHHTSPQHLQSLHRPRTMPQLRPRIPTHRHARSLGRHDQQTTSRRTKKQRHQSNPPLTSPNVPPLTTTHPTLITKHQTPHIHKRRRTISPTTRLQHPLARKIRPQHRTSIR